MSLRQDVFQSVHTVTTPDNQQFLYADTDEQIEETEEDNHKKTSYPFAVLSANSQFFSQASFIQTELQVLNGTIPPVSVSRLFVLFRNFRL